MAGCLLRHLGMMHRPLAGSAQSFSVDARLVGCCFGMTRGWPGRAAYRRDPCPANLACTDGPVGCCMEVLCPCRPAFELLCPWRSVWRCRSRPPAGCQPGAVLPSACSATATATQVGGVAGPGRGAAWRLGTCATAPGSHPAAVCAIPGVHHLAMVPAGCAPVESLSACRLRSHLAS